MFYTTVLDTAVGLIFTFLAVSLVSSAITEAISSAVKWRSRTLLAGVQALLNDKDFTGLAKDIYNHALINPRFGGGATTTRQLSKLPAYIDPNQFAAAFTEVTNLAGKAPDGVKADIDNITDPQIKQLLNGICQRAGGDLPSMRNEISAWFDSAMDRVSGAYKRDAQLVGFLVALIIAVVLNVSSIRVAMVLWHEPAATQSIDLNNEPLAGGDAGKKLVPSGLPIGWPATGEDAKAVCPSVSCDNIFYGLTAGEWRHRGDGWWVTSIVGWLITAGATLFGAPFWFDTLQQFVRLKGSGPSPAEKTENKGAAA